MLLVAVLAAGCGGNSQSQADRVQSSIQKAIHALPKLSAQQTANHKAAQKEHRHLCVLLRSAIAKGEGAAIVPGSGVSVNKLAARDHC